MNKYLTKGRIALLVIFSVLIADQIIKIYVKTHMYWHQSENAIKWLYEKLGMVDAEPPTWFYIYFTENNGMAFGMEIFGKLFLTLFRIVAVGAIGWYLTRIIKQGLKTGYIVCVSLILTGALGNIIDTNWPQWIPLVGGDHFIFFSPIFNLADAAISCGIIALLLFYSKYLNDSYHAIKKS